MLTIKIYIDVEDQEEAQMTLQYIADQIGYGFVSGIDWSLSGEPEQTDEE